MAAKTGEIEAAVNAAKKRTARLCERFPIY